MIKVAKALKNNSIEIKKITDSTGLTEDEINGL